LGNPTGDPDIFADLWTGCEKSEEESQEGKEEKEEYEEANLAQRATKKREYNKTQENQAEIMKKIRKL
jgi:hypothetical protein